MSTRIAKVVIHGNITPEVVAAYLPSNYRVISTEMHTDDDDTREHGHVIIAGRDHHGWTLNGYVIPRLASGLIAAEEIKTDLESMVRDGLAS